MTKKITSAKTQYIGTFCATLVVMGYGATCGWPSPTFPLLESEERTPFADGALNIDQISWIGSLICPGGLLGTLLGGWMCDKFGRKFSTCVVALPQIASWVFIIFADGVVHLYISRFLGGLAGGIAFVAVPIFIAEIAETEIRGFLGSMLVFAANFGIFFAYIAGAFLDFYSVPLVFLVLPIALLAGFIYLPETPSYLATHGRYMDAEESLRFYRCLPRGNNECESFTKELAALKNCDVQSANNKILKEKIQITDFASRHAKRAVLIGVVLVVLNQFCGCFAMLNYTASIFEKAGSTLSPNISAIIVGFIQIVGSFFSTILVDRAGRKFCIAISAGGTCIGLAILGTYTYLDMIGIDTSKFLWIPLVSFSFVIFIASWGVLTLPFLVLSEIMPEKIKAFTTTLCMSILWICAFIAIKSLPTLIQYLEMYGTMFLFSTFSLIGTILVLLLQPETKGKTFSEISKILGK
ncbi:facilitated trehalose transporter Tret1-like [Culicoides brevitarsis]|uniref:facilitated trehalose transporter Tret1-like n=1 Tax=Culicoides brevitarsis TaxID=469753 RepID=UPI00307BACB1